MTPKQRWLSATWPQVRDALPAAPSDVLEIGCGSLGGFVPMLRDAGYTAVGVDPEAPEGRDFARQHFEEYEPPQPVDAVVACTSLHHVHDLADVLDRVAAALVPRGLVVVVEWAWERFDEAGARWCFARLGEPPGEDEQGWLHRHQQRWAESGLGWADYWQLWTAEERLIPAADIVASLDGRFQRTALGTGPYAFPELEGVDVAEEAAAISAGDIPALGITWVGRRPATR